ncbi:MAG: hypothetical protein ACR2PT_03260 [Endozoicomonas sp.]
MKISLSQIRHEIRSAPVIKLVVKLWKNWKVHSGSDSLDKLLTSLKQAKAPHGNTAAGKPLQTHKVAKYQPSSPASAPSPSTIKMGLTYSPEAFEMECATQFFPTQHSKEVVSALETLRQSCIEGTNRKTLLLQLHNIEEKAWLFEKDVQDMPPSEQHLVVPHHGKPLVILDTDSNRARHGINQQNLPRYQIDLKSLRQNAVDKIHALAGHVTRVVSPAKIEVSLRKLEERFARQPDYFNSQFSKDLTALVPRILNFKTQCDALIESGDEVLREIGEKWLSDCCDLESRLQENLSLSSNRPKPYQRRMPRG